MIDAFSVDFLVLFFFNPFSKALGKCECEDMYNAKIMEDGCSQMKGHFWIILFFFFLVSFSKMPKEEFFFL